MLRIIVSVLAFLLVIAIACQYFFGVISDAIVQGLLWVTVILYLVYILTKIRKKK